MTKTEAEEVLQAASKLAQGWQAEVARVEAKLATLKREHEQLRAAAYNYVYAEDRDRAKTWDAFLAALNATPTEPARETFDPEAVREVLRRADDVCWIDVDISDDRSKLAHDALREAMNRCTENKP